jgi:putative ABC transport system permease protein
MFWIIVKVALKSLWGSKLRSFLAILGIVMGVGAVISMLAIVEGARRQIESMIGTLGTDVLFVWPESRGVSGRAAAPQLKLDDARAVLEGAPSVVRVSPMMQVGVSVKCGNKSTRTTVDGVAPTYLLIRNMVVEKGRAFTDAEVRDDARVAVIGPKTAEKLFGTQDPLEQTIKVNQVVFRIIGVLKSRGAQGAFGNDDDRLVAPFSTVRRQLLGALADSSAICIQAVSREQLKSAEDEIRRVLRKRHRLGPTTKDDFGIFNQAELLEMQSQAIYIFGVVLGGIGGICLLTGGIGIMNIMLVIVTERTREIGIRKAVGAKGADILVQFLLEAVLMSACGGVIGILGGVGLGTLVSLLTPLKTAVSLWSVLLALFFAAAVGIFFGFYPAWRASRLDPIVALHVE